MGGSHLSPPDVAVHWGLCAAPPWLTGSFITHSHLIWQVLSNAQGSLGSPTGAGWGLQGFQLRTQARLSELNPRALVGSRREMIILGAGKGD